MKTSERVVWLFPSLQRGYYWQPLFRSFAKNVEKSVVFAGLWERFLEGYEGKIDVKTVGSTKLFPSRNGYTAFALPSFKIFPEIIKMRPTHVFASGFNLWTMQAIFLKLVLGYSLSVIYDGSSYDVDAINNILKTTYRWLLAKFVDSWITNTKAGKEYLITTLRVLPSKIVQQPYQIPVSEFFPVSPPKKLSSKITFISVGRLVKSKGVQNLLAACTYLTKMGVTGFKVMVVGGGHHENELKGFCVANGIGDYVEWIGPANYEELTKFYSAADVFVFPTHQDVWGLVLLEAMASGLPVISSIFAGASELVQNNKNGFIVNPLNVNELVDKMLYFINKPMEVEIMGKRSNEIIGSITLEDAVDAFIRTMNI